MSNNTNPFIIRLIINLAGIVFIQVNYIVNIIFRKNFSMGQYYIPSQIFITLLLFAVGVLFLVIGVSYDKSLLFFGSQISFYITSILFVALAIFVFRKARINGKNAIKNQIPLNDQGDSRLLSFLKENYNWSDGKIKYFAEPFYLIFIGGLYCFFNIFGGIIIASLSLFVWLSALTIYITQALKGHQRPQANNSINRVSNN